MKHWEKKANGWVFLSHSSKDYDDVKIVRNYLEENGFSALMFYLKCLDDEKKHLREELIESEIKSRNIFVLCRSTNSDVSKWVKWEFDTVQEYTNKIVKEIDMNTLKYKKATALSVLDDLVNYATLYFLFHSNDNNIVERIYKKLNSKGFKILKNNPKETSLRKEKDKYFNLAIEEASEQGTVLIFLSQHVLHSKWFWNQKEMILNTKNKNFIIPIILDDVSIEEFSAFRNSKYIIRFQNFEHDLIIEKICETIDRVREDKKLL